MNHHRTMRLTALRGLLLSLVAAAFCLPLVWMLATSLRPTETALQRSLAILPTIRSDADSGELSWFEARYWLTVAATLRDNFAAVWTSPLADFPIYFKNSLYVSLLSAIGMTLSSAIVAFGFSRLRWRGRDGLFRVLLATMMIPFAVLMAPTYLVFKQLGWIGTLVPLWAPCWFGGAFSIFLVRQFYMTIPRELDEAAMLDGCSNWGILWRMIIPLSRPVLTVVALLQFVHSWNDFVGPLIFLNHEETYTLALGLAMFQSSHGGTPWNLVMAADVIVILPVIVVFMLAQRALIEGVASGGLKE
ncbi:MAG: carbohydrate ABC transporter permease [Phycisphaerales bacterium]|nr:carbohydrate ABC transporter permease [Phycisphaerales bacterium]